MLSLLLLFFVIITKPTAHCPEALRDYADSSLGLLKIRTESEPHPHPQSQPQR